MFNKNNLKKINFLFGLVTMLVFLFGFFNIQFQGATIVNNIPNIELTILNPIKSIIVDLVGTDYGQLITNILSLNIAWYVVVVFPVWCWYFIRGCFNL